MLRPSPLATSSGRLPVVDKTTAAAGRSAGAVADVEVAVVGGGLVGAAAALAAARAGRSVALLDLHRPVTRTGKFGFDIRTVALSPVSLALLGDLGVEMGGTSYDRIVVWEEQGTARLHFDAADAYRDSLGSIVGVGPAVERLWAALDAQPNATLLDGFDLSDVDLAADRVQLMDGVGGRQVECRLLIAADGIDSAVRRLLAVDARRNPTGHHALATMVRTGNPHGGVAYQCFRSGGPLALLPGPEDDLVSVIWSQSPDAAEERRILADAEFCAELSRASERCLGRVLDTDARVVLPLEQLVADDFHPHRRVVVIGDAARVLHPLAGLGVNLGFEDVAALASLLAAPPPWDEGDWQTFARRRRLRAQVMTTLMTAFQTAYELRDPLIRLMRNTVVGALDSSPAIKSQLIREALGLGPLAAASRK